MAHVQSPVGEKFSANYAICANRTSWGIRELLTKVEGNSGWETRPVDQSSSFTSNLGKLEVRLGVGLQVLIFNWMLLQEIIIILIVWKYS